MVGGLMSEQVTVPLTPLARYYGLLKEQKSGIKSRVPEAERLAENPSELVDLFNGSVEQTLAFYESNPRAPEAFFDQDRPLADDLEGSLESTDALAKLFERDRADREDPRLRVEGDSSLDFYFVERELVVTRAPGWRLEPKNPGPGRSTRLGLRVDQLLANADDRTPILAEVKIKRDKDPFFALIQVLAAAAYLAPSAQLDRTRQHDRFDRLDTSDGRVDAYLLIAPPPTSEPWFALRDRAAEIAEAAAPAIGTWVRTIAALDLSSSSASNPPLTIRELFSFRSLKS
jgi:hypothetical protein